LAAYAFAAIIASAELYAGQPDDVTHGIMNRRMSLPSSSPA